MDRLDMALRRYAQITADASPAASRMQAEELATWLEQDVCGIVDILWDHAGFRDRVRWPVDRLCGQEDQRERRLVKEVDRALVSSARQLSSFARESTIFEKLPRFGPYEEELPPNDQSGLEPSSGLPLGLSLAEYIAQRP